MRSSLGGLRRNDRRQVERRSRRVDRHQFLDHGVATGKAGELVAAHGILGGVEQTFVAIGARPLGQVAAHCCTRSVLATSERAMATPSNAPEWMPLRMNEAVW